MRKASQELQQSQRLARVLEMVLAMGNYMNKGNQRVGQAAGFRVAFLAQVSGSAVQVGNTEGNIEDVQLGFNSLS